MLEIRMQRARFSKKNKTALFYSGKLQYGALSRTGKICSQSICRKIAVKESQETWTAR